MNLSMRRVMYVRRVGRYWKSISHAKGIEIELDEEKTRRQEEKINKKD